MRVRLPISIALLLLMVGCAHVPPPPAKPTGLKPTAFWREQEIRRQQTRQLSSKIYFRYESKKQNVGGQGRLVLQPPGELRMELRDPFGRLHYVVTMHDKEFVARYPRQNLAYLDRNGGAAYLKKVLGIGVSFSDLKSLLVGVVPDSLRKKDFDSWTWDGTEGVYVGTLKLTDREVEAGVDPDRGILRSLKVSGMKADNVAIHYSDYGSCCQIEGDGPGSPFTLARVVSMQMEDTGARVGVEWQKVESFRDAKPADVFQAELPAETKKVYLD